LSAHAFIATIVPSPTHYSKQRNRLRKKTCYLKEIKIKTFLLTVIFTINFFSGGKCFTTQGSCTKYGKLKLSTGGCCSINQNEAIFGRGLNVLVRHEIDSAYFFVRLN
jgi:hypothetical protein